ncbi:polysialyltransferase family glycosyltransferase [Vreelandella sp. V005]|uniref:polysialyltransferase family glycosyltransferase n=1 Tax=Vreelandella sp. V005 TaxID=3459608 RepID=UPI0040440765
MKKYLLVFSYTKYHEDLLSRVNLQEEYPEFNIINFKSELNNGKIVSAISKVMMVLKFFIMRVFLFSDKKSVSILLPHPEQLLSNYFFYSDRVSAISLYEDGLLNYIDVRLSGGFKKRSEKRKLIGLCLLYKFRSIEGHLSGCQERPISRGYFQHPEMLYLPERFNKVIKIDADHKSLLNIDYSIALFVDQNVEALYGEVEGGRLREELYKFLKNYKKVFVKLHHDYVAGNFSTTNMPDNFELLPAETQKGVAENIVENLNVGVVCGFTSTALINIACRYTDTRCYCCVSDSHMVLSNLGEEKMSDFLGRFNIEGVGKISN